jgi:chaperone BCS1
MIDLALLQQYLGKAEAIYQAFTAFTKENPVVGGMFGMWLLGAATYIVRLIPDKLSYLFHRYCTVSVTISNRESSYQHILVWLQTHNKMAHPRTVRVTNGRWGDGKLNITAGLGHHYFRVGLRPYKLTRYKEKSDATTAIKEEITLTTIGFKTTSLIKFVENTQPKQSENKPEIFMWKGDDWSYIQDLSYRSLDSIILKKGQKKRILDFIDKFENNKDWYYRTGVPYRTGILLSGPAGTGKTSLIRAIASDRGKDLRIINCSATSDLSILAAMSEVPEDSIILLEDFDSIDVTKSREENGKVVTFGMTLSGLLNALDGVFSSEGRIVIATTNYPDKLDKALLRPGRFDLKEELGYVDKDMVNRIYFKFFPDDEIDDIHCETPVGISPAQIENCCLINKDKPFNALTSIHETIEKKKTNIKTNTGNTKETSSSSPRSTYNKSIHG